MAEIGIPTILETVTGKFIDLLDPNPADICIEDIAWSLSRLPRFNGHTIQAVPYTVGQHSIAVSNEAERYMVGSSRFQSLPVNIALESAYLGMLGLLHDASEAYTGDVPGPLKKIPEFRPVIKKIENTIQAAIYKSLGIHPPTEFEEEIVKKADLLSERIEAYNFMVSRGQHWSNMPEVSIVRLQDFETPSLSVEVYNNFLATYHRLKNNL